MSITKDFEKKVHGVADEYILEYMYDQPDVIELLVHARALEAMLKKHEWSGFREDGAYICPECREPEFRGLVNGKHDEDCQLAKLLEGVEDQK